MKELESIMKLSNTTGVSPSALRYWDKEGLLRFQRNSENQYRMPSLETLLDLGEVLLYRNCSVPIAKLKTLRQWDTMQWQKVLEESESACLDKQRELERSLEKIQQKKEMFAKVSYYRKNGFSLCSLVFPAISVFSYLEKQIFEAYIADSYQSVVLWNGKTLEYGICLEESKQPLLRAQDEKEKLYLRGLFSVESDALECHTGEDFVLHAKALGYEAGALIGRYLLSAWDTEADKRYDYYEGYLELVA